MAVVCCTRRFAEATGWEYRRESSGLAGPFGRAQGVLFVATGSLEVVFERGRGKQLAVVLR